MAESIRRFDVLVIGAGPAGLNAAAAAASHGVRVGLIDAQPRPGGQVWRHDVAVPPPSQAVEALATVSRRGVEWIAQAQVAQVEPESLRVETAQGVLRLHYRSLVLATGARELLLPFPGWTLPGVSGAGGAQALAKQGWPMTGKRVIVAGSGPLLLAAAVTLKRHGAQVLGIHEQASSGAVRAFALRLPRWPGKAAQALGMKLQLAGIAYRTGSMAVAAHGDARLREVEIDGPRGRERIACDHLAVGYGLVPSTELAQLIGCRLDLEGTHPAVVVDAELRTSVDRVFAAGEALGIGGRDCAQVEGAMAGHFAAGQPGPARALQGKRRHARAFAELLARSFPLDPRVRDLADADTVICRCEDVALRQLQGFASARDARLATRCGMGACQGRICGTALAELALACAESPGADRRPPLFPARLATLAESFSNHSSQGAIT